MGTKTIGKVCIMGNATRRNRIGNSHAGETICVLSRGFFGMEKLSATTRIIFNALYSFAQKKDARAEFTFSELAARYHISYASVSRGMKKIYDFFKKGETPCTYALKEEVQVPELYIYIPDWLRFAQFPTENGTVDLTHNQILILSYIMHQSSHLKRWNRTQAGISRDLDISPSTVSEAITRFDRLGILSVHCSSAVRNKAANHYERTFYTLNYELLGEVREQTIHNLKTLPRTVRDADARTDRERFYAARKRVAWTHANTVKRALGQDYLDLERAVSELELQIAKAQHQKELASVRALMERRMEIRRAMRDFLLSRGYTEEDLSPRFVCKDCEDTGVRKDGTLCNCYLPPSPGGKP